MRDFFIGIFIAMSNISTNIQSVCFMDEFPQGTLEFIDRKTMLFRK